MKYLILLLLLSSLAFTSCSSSKKGDANKEGQEVTDILDGESDFIVDGDNEDLIIEDEDIALAEDKKIEVDTIEEIETAAAPVSSAPIIAEDGSYTIKNGETLMMASFNIYGDYRRWKELANYNGINQNNIKAGTTIRYQMPAQEFRWNPDGLPYLIKRGDTLGTISNDKYGTAKKWRMIYDNNKPLIRDPNLIFAGFTLYYVPLRDVASK